MGAVIKINNLKISTQNPEGKVLVDIPRLDFIRGWFTAIIGESGAGKSLTSLATLGLIPDDLSAEGAVVFASERGADGKIDLLRTPPNQLSKIRAVNFGYMVQQPFLAFNPRMTLGKQVMERLVNKGGHKSKSENRNKVLALFAKLNLAEPERIFSSYPFEVSGGQLQRVGIASAFITEPEVIVADEPTSSLDDDSKREILSLLVSHCLEMGITLIMVTHDLEIVKTYAHQIVTLKNGRVVYDHPATQSPEEPYTAELFSLNKLYHSDSNSIFKSSNNRNQWLQDSLITDGVEVAIHRGEVNYLKNRLWGMKIKTTALQGVNVNFAKGCRTGIYGESGSGKSTLGKVLCGLLPLNRGELVIDQNQYPYGLNDRRFPKIQMVFQDPMSSFNPVKRIGPQLKSAVPIENRNHWAPEEYLHQFGLDSEVLQRLPRQLSGGQIQRLAIIRALLTQPKGIVFDEFVTGLDIAWKLKVIELVQQISQSLDLNIWVISHEKVVLRHLCNSWLEMHNGKLNPIEQLPS